jgi:hypothetical protein
MRMAFLGVLLLAGSAAMGQTAAAQNDAALAETPAAPAQPLLSLQQSLPAQAGEFFMQNPQTSGVLQLQPGLPAPKNLLAKNQPLQLIGPPASHAQAGAIPIPTQWPHAKMEAIPTRWPDLKLVPLQAAPPATPGK